MKNATLRQAVKIISLFKETPVEQVQAILESGFLADLRDGNITDVNRDEFRKVIGLKPLTPKPEPLLESLGTVTVPATTKRFVAKDQFVVDTSQNAKVEISSLGDDLKSWFFSKIEEPISETTLRYHELREASLDGPIIVELGGEAKAETTLTEMFSLMERQKNGESGVLLANGHWNIFYIRDVTGGLCTVGVYWFGDGWSVNTPSIAGSRWFGGGDRVFSRNS